MISTDFTPAPPAIADAADRVARAELILADHRRVTQQARDAEDQMRHRLATLDERRAAIASRRADGDKRDGDAGEVELITLDRAELESMQAEAAAMVAREQADEQRAQEALVTAQWSWRARSTS